MVIQTYQPGHYSIIHAANQDYEAFYEAEEAYREMLLYPPAAHMMAVQITAAEENRGEKLAEMLSEKIKAEQKNIAEEGEAKAAVIGPAKAGIGRINDMFRYVFYVKARQYTQLIRIKDELEEVLFDMQLKRETVQFDFDPIHAF